MKSDIIADIFLDNIVSSEATPVLSKVKRGLVYFYFIRVESYTFLQRCCTRLDHIAVIFRTSPG